MSGYAYDDINDSTERSIAWAKEVDRDENGFIDDDIEVITTHVGRLVDEIERLRKYVAELEERDRR